MPYTANLRRCFTLFKFCIYIFVFFLISLALIVVSVQEGVNNQDKSALFAGIFVLIAIPISLWEIIHHLFFYSRPSLQKHIIRILWMVPIYALNAWFGLVHPEYGIYFDSVRECYEAYAIYNFLVYLLNYLNEEMDLEINLSLKPQVKHYFPLCWLPNWRMGRELVHRCKHGILQYTILRPLTTTIAFICELNGVYGEGEFRGNAAFPYLIGINNFSQSLAMYCLVLFYKANKEELRPMEPIGKFICIKAVVFFSFFQGVLISVAAYYGILQTYFDAPDDVSANYLSNRIQNFLICFEMLIAALAHHYSFSYKPYVNYLVENRAICDAFLSMWDFSDVQADLKEHFGVVGSSISNINKQFRGQSSNDEERSSLISPNQSTSSKYCSIDS